METSDIWLGPNLSYSFFILYVNYKASFFLQRRYFMFMPWEEVEKSEVLKVPFCFLELDS